VAENVGREPDERQRVSIDDFADLGEQGDLR
jgi:hypothetical protein